MEPVLGSWRNLDPDPDACMQDSDLKPTIDM